MKLLKRRKAIARNTERQRAKLSLEIPAAKTVALVEGLRKLVSVGLFIRRLSRLAACEKGIHFSLWRSAGEGRYAASEMVSCPRGRPMLEVWKRAIKKAPKGALFSRMSDLESDSGRNQA